MNRPCYTERIAFVMLKDREQLASGYFDVDEHHSVLCPRDQCRLVDSCVTFDNISRSSYTSASFVKLTINQVILA